jgi:phosphoribosyl-ATP pyrophosphohydrolase
MASEQFLAQLWATIESRKAEAGPENSYTRELLANPSMARKKVAEEAHEVNEAHQALLAGHDSKDHLAHEAADLIYHLFVVLASADVTPTEVYAVLQGRHLARAPRATKSP